mmetsp:Transcript_23719/g.48072  ORF Transcript_23719/g.48072 Transcript_23719/m.48072 type:complete len:225 (+) Transcript_23719:221-895(+)
MPPVDHKRSGVAICCGHGDHRIFLINAGTGGRVPVRSGATVAFDQNGWAFTTFPSSADAEAPVWAKTLLQKPLHETPDGCFIYDKRDKSKVWIKELANKGTQKYPHIDMSGQIITMGTMVFKLCKAGAACYWDLRVFQDHFRAQEARQTEAAAWRDKQRDWRAKQSKAGHGGAAKDTAAAPSTGASKLARTADTRVPKNLDVKKANTIATLHVDTVANCSRQAE